MGFKLRLSELTDKHNESAVVSVFLDAVHDFFYDLDRKFSTRISRGNVEAILKVRNARGINKSYRAILDSFDGSGAELNSSLKQDFLLSLDAFLIRVFNISPDQFYELVKIFVFNEYRFKEHLKSLNYSKRVEFIHDFKNQLFSCTTIESLSSFSEILDSLFIKNHEIESISSNPNSQFSPENFEDISIESVLKCYFWAFFSREADGIESLFENEESIKSVLVEIRELMDDVAKNHPGHLNRLLNDFKEALPFLMSKLRNIEKNERSSYLLWFISTLKSRVSNLLNPVDYDPTEDLEAAQ